MSPRIQVICTEEEAARFRLRAEKESKSLSAWLRDAGRAVLEQSEKRQPLTTPAALEQFFTRCDEFERGKEPDWEEYKRVILEGYTSRTAI